MAVKASAEITITDRADATAIRAWYHAQTSAVAPSAPTTTSASATPTGWTLAEPTVSSPSDLSKYVYRCEQLVWGDGTCDWGTVTLSASYEAAKVAYNEAQAAKTTATRYITELSDGIMVHPDGDTTTGWSIRDALEMIKSGISAFRIWLEGSLPKVRIGKEDKSHVVIDYHSLQLVDEVDTTYMHVSDLRDSSGLATVAESFVGTGRKKSFTVNHNVTVDGTWVATDESHSGNTATRNGNQFTFATAPDAGAVVVIRYQTSNLSAKAYTLGYRAGDPGRYSFVEGYGNRASNFAVHAEGSFTHALGDSSHAQGMDTKAQGAASHAGGMGTTALGDAQTVIGKNNVLDYDKQYAFIIGNGEDYETRSNAAAVDWDGNLVLAGAVDGELPAAKLTGTIDSGRLPTVPLAKGGTGATTASAARTALGAAAASHEHDAADITSGTLPLGRGGTGATSAAGALAAIGAAAADHTHTPASIGAATASHTHTPASIGAAASSHSHGVGDITGTLGRDHGGTGVTGLTTESVTRSGVGTAGNFSVRHNGMTVTVSGDSLRLKTALASGNNSYVTLGTISTAAYRPSSDMYGIMATSNTSFAGRCMVRIMPNGNVLLYNASGTSLATSVNVNFSVTWSI